MPGMYARVTVELESKEQAMMIPSRAIRVQGDELYVIVAADDVAVRKPIKIGYDDGIDAEILGGLDSSDRVVVSSGGTVTSGTPLRVVKQTAAREPAKELP